MNKRTGQTSDQAFNKIRDALDKAVESLSREDYKEVLDRLGSELDARKDCIREEEA